MGARHTPRLAHACSELTTLFPILQTAVKGWRSSKQNKKARRGLVHRVSSSSDCFFFYLSPFGLLASSLCLALSGLAGLPIVVFNRPHFVMKVSIHNLLFWVSFGVLVAFLSESNGILRIQLTQSDVRKYKARLGRTVKIVGHTLILCISQTRPLYSKFLQ